MKKTLLLLLVFVFTSVSAQFNETAPWMQGQNFRNQSGQINFQEVVDAFNIYWETRDPNVKGSGFKPFKRWEAYWENFVNADGYLPTSSTLFNTSQIISQTRDNQEDVSNWTALGPNDFLNRPTSFANVGRVNVIVKDPNNEQRLFVGAPSGGIWRSVNGGQDWTPLIDDLPQIGVSGIAIDPNNSNTMYIATGDDDAGDAPGVGVWKSTDGGDSWAATGLNQNNSPARMNDIYVHPTNSNILWVATTSGVFKTSNAGTSWTNTLTGNIRDIKVKPNDPSTLYAVTSNRFYKSTNGGDSFFLSSTGLPLNSGRLVIDVTPANSNLVYVVSATTNNGYQGIYKSTDSGDSFTQKANTTNIFESTQAWYDLAFAVSDTNENELYVGVLNIWKSSNGGDSFTKINQWNVRNAAYTHADIHFLRFFDGDLFCGSDGGFFKSTDDGNTFTDLTVGMEIGQFYRISVSQQTSNRIAGGTQDNAGFGYDAGQWNNFYTSTADGMECVVDPNDDNIYYGFIQFGGALQVSTDAGQSNSTVFGGAENGNWITPLNVNSQSEVYAGYSRVFRFDSGSWSPISPSFNSNIDVLEIDDIDPDNMYVAINNSLRKSIDRGINFTTTESFSTNITSIEVNNNDSNILYVTTSGTSSGSVYRSNDGGETFTNITGSLPNITKNIIKHQKNAATNPLYLGTNVGVYRFDDNLGDWELYSNDLPNTSVRDLDINLPDNKLIAGTYGRGIWISELAPSDLAENDVRMVALLGINDSSISCGSIAPQITIENNGLNTISSVDISYTIDTTTDGFTWTGTLEPQAITTINLPEITLARGIHDLSVSASIANDNFPGNNATQTTFFVNDTGTAQLINTFESPEDELLSVSNTSTLLWERGVPQGTLLNTAASGTQVYGTNLDGNHPDNTRAFLVSQCYDLEAIDNPILKFSMAFDLEFDWDLVYVEYSTDEGLNWAHLGVGDAEDVWYNSTRIAGDNGGNNCFNCVGGQWTGTEATMTQYTRKLNELTTEPSVIFRIVFHSDQAVNEEGAIIDDFYIDGTLGTEEFSSENISVYPNPSKGIFNVKTINIANFDYQIVDVAGKVVLNNTVKNDTGFTLDMNGFASGMYFLKIEDTSGAQLIKKIVLE